MLAPKARIASTCRLTGRRPMRSPPGLLMMTRPNRDSSGPSRMKLARILAAASTGTKSQSTSPEAISYVLGSGRSTTTPRSRSVSAMTRTSSMTGTLVSRQRSPVRVAAAISLRAAFLEPLIATRPFNGRPPSTRKTSRGTGAGSYSQWNGRASATISRRLGERPRSAASPGALAMAALRDPDADERGLELRSRQRQVGRLLEAALERLLGLRLGRQRTLQVDLGGHVGR